MVALFRPLNMEPGVLIDIARKKILFCLFKERKQKRGFALSLGSRG